jgi:CxxC motif-containing protein (DUF1111 family)
MSKNAIQTAVVSSLACTLLTGCGDKAAQETAPVAVSEALVDPDADDGARLATAFGDPLPGLNGDEAVRFAEGKTEFEEDEEPDEGLGPVFNDTSCLQCHSVPASGGGSTRLETRFGKGKNAKFDPLTGSGGSLIQENGIGVFPDPSGAAACNYVGEIVPAPANPVSKRRSTPLFGLGLVDALPESAFHDLAQREASLFPGEAGRVGIVNGAVGRFGWKNQVPNLRTFAGDAYLNEMGITSPDFPDENCPQGDCSLLRCNPGPTPVNDDGSGVTAFEDFMTLLAPPPRGPISGNVARGQEVFHTVGCNHCHTPTLVTGSSPIAALSNQTFHPYSDFLLHDMGKLGDGIPLGGAAGGEFRTAPLWGVNQITSFLHDGSASSVSAAIEAHDGQGKTASKQFHALSAQDRQALLDFVNSL